MTSKRRLRIGIVGLLIFALIMVGRVAWWPIYQYICFEETESGELSNGWPYSLREHSFSDEPRFLLLVEPPDRAPIKLQAYRVRIAAQMDGTDAIQYGVKGLPWESHVLEWAEFARSPGLWNHGRD